jgi:hypothetical protein
MRIFQTTNYLTFTGEVPCDTAIDCWLKTNTIELERLVAHSRHFEHAYLAWETVRNARNPFFAMGTGFEGYLVSISRDADAALQTLLKIGHSMLESNCRMYRFNHLFQSRLMKNLTGERSDPDAMEVWSALLGAALGRLRVNIYRNPEAAQFQNETYQLVKYLPAIHYSEHDYVIEQEYAILPGENRVRTRISLDDLKPCDYDAGLVIWSVGRFGHPLIREFLRVEATAHCMDY